VHPLQNERNGFKESEMDDMRPRSITDEQIAEARKLRASGMSYVKIAKKLGTSDNGIRLYCQDVKPTVAPLDNKLCPECGEALPQKARFCFMCGTRILTEREKIVQELDHMRNIIMFIPENRRDSVMDAVNHAIKYLKSLED
jgi:transcriptional regulator